MANCTIKGVILTARIGMVLTAVMLKLFQKGSRIIDFRRSVWKGMIVILQVQKLVLMLSWTGSNGSKASQCNSEFLKNISIMVFIGTATILEYLSNVYERFTCISLHKALTS